MIHAAIDLLGSGGLIDARGADPDFSPYNGYCARACAAYGYLVAHDAPARRLSQNQTLKLKRLSNPGAEYGDSHYWLEDADGRVLDLIFGRQRRLSRHIDYGSGMGAAVRRNSKDRNLPAAKDTQRMIAVIQTALG